MSGPGPSSWWSNIGRVAIKTPTAIAGGEPRRQTWWSRHPWVVDSIVAAVYFVFALVLLALSELLDVSDDPWSLPFSLAVLFGTVAAVLLRRRWTVSMSVVVLLLGVLSVYQGTGADVVAIPIMLYSLAVFRTSRVTGLFLVLFVTLIGSAPFLPEAPAGNQEDVESIALLLLSGVLVDLPAMLLLLFSAVSGVLVGVTVRNRHRHKAAIIERAAQLEREQEQLAQLAAASERTRIAREMHDIVSHTLTVVVTLADGAVASKDEAASKRAMTGAADAARNALTDLRRLLGALREEGNAPLTPQPDAHALPELMDRFARAGLPTKLDVTGTPDDDPAVSFAIHRIVQEGLTNALRYSRGATQATVSIDYSPDGVDVVVENDGALKNAPSVGAGQGLLGLRERLDMLDGRINIGPSGDGVWRLQAWIPRGGAPEESAAS